MYIPEST